MKNKFVKNIILTLLAISFLIAIIFFVRVHIKTKEFKGFFNNGVQSYLSGNMESAVADFKKALEIKPNDKKVKSILIKTVVELSLKYYLDGKQDNAINTISTAIFIDANDPLVRNAYTQIVKGVVLADSSITKRLQEEETLKTSLSAIKTEIVQLINSYITVEFQKMFGQSEEKMKALSQKSDIIIWILIIIFLIGFTGMVFISILKYYEYKRESALYKMHKELLDEVHGKTSVLVEGTVLGLPEAQGPKIQEIKIIEAELVDENDAEIGERLISPYLNDSDIKVQAIAAKVMYKYNKISAIHKLDEMIKISDSSARIYAVKSLEEINTDETANMILCLVADSDSNVKKEVLKSLWRLKSKKEISAPIKKEIEYILQKVKSEGEWII
ncbi:MAG: HEAT repeat domain-containing protein [Candidatus Firestonebacteria bacterium]